MPDRTKDFLKSWVWEPFQPALGHALRMFVRCFPVNTGTGWHWMGIISPVEHDESRMLVRTFFGARMVLDIRDLIDNRIYYFGVWEPNLTAFIGRTLRAGDIFVDVGANTGFFSLWAASLVGPNGHVVAIEASPSTFRILRENIEINQSTNLRSVNIAASDRAGVLKLFYGPKSNRGEASIIEGDASLCEAEVESLPVDEILHSEEFRRVRLVKVDVEGAEWLVACGLKKLLSRGRADLEVVIEVAPNRLQKIGYAADKFVALFREYGFHAYKLTNDYSFMSYIPPRSIGHPIRIYGSIEEQVDVVFSRIDASKLS